MKAFLWSVAGIATYLASGTLWAFYQWRLFVKGEIDYYESERRRFLAFHRVRGIEVPDFLKPDWREYVNINNRLKAVPPKHEEYTSSLALNFSLWWVSMLYMIGQFLYKITIQRIIVESMNSTNEKINQVKKDLK